MSKKKKQSKSKSESVPQKAANQEVSIQDDPYWEVATTHMDIQRLGRYVTIFERFEYEHPQWIDDLMGGVPTYYCVLGVERGSSKNRIEQAYEQKTDFSSYPAETIEEAFCVLSDPKLQKKYDELLSVFKQITKAMPQEDKVEFIEVHNSHVNSEKDYVRMEQLLDTYKKYYTMYTMGMPDFYEIMQLPQDCSVEEIKKYINSDSKLLKRISSILCDKTLRDDHDFLLYFYRNHTQQKYIAQRHERMKKWDLIERPIFEHIILNIMDKSEDIMASMIRCTDIVNANHDWRNYLSPVSYTH